MTQPDMSNRINTIETTPDFEFGLSSGRQCRYSVYNTEQAGNGLVVYIPGFGSDAGEYPDVFCQKIAAKYEIATLHVHYFCLNARPKLGAQVIFEQSDLEQLANRLHQFGGRRSDSIQKDYQTLAGLANHNKVPTTLNASLVPPNGEYQNFGILPALDIINACRHAIQHFSVNPNNIILTGSSYGGYIGNLVAKLAPGLTRAVFDNSSWAKPNLAYVVGRDLNIPEYVHRENNYFHVHLYVRSPWTLTSGLPNSFDNERWAIRAFTDTHIAQMRTQGCDQTRFFFYHSAQDGVAKVDDKMVMNKHLNHHGIDSRLTVCGEDDVDGHFIKSLEHGMSMSMVRLFNQCYPLLDEHCDTLTQPNSVRYTHNQRQYLFDHTCHPVRAIITDIE